MVPVQNIFLEVKDPLELLKLMDALVAGRIEMLAKSSSPESKIFRLKAFQYQKEELACLIRSDSDEFPESESMILQFQVGDQKFVVQVDAEKKIDVAHLRRTSALFRIQRRDDFRIRVPSSFSAKLQLGEEVFLVLDLSAGGLKIQLPKERKLSAEFEAELVLKDRKNLKVLCSTRHRAADPLQSRWDQLGVQFLKMQKKDKNFLAGVVMDIYREYLRK